MEMESGGNPEAEAPSGSPQQGISIAEEIEECTATTKGDSPPSVAVGTDHDICRQDLSPLSTPEGLGASGACERGKKWCGPGEKIDAQRSSEVDDASPHCAGDAPPHIEDTDKATPLAKAVVRRQDMKQAKKEAQSIEGSAHDRTSVVVLKGRTSGLSGGGCEATAASEQQKARDQAKRLALEVGRLRSTLRATTSELNTERSTRVRIEV